MNKDIGQDLYFLESVSHIKDISKQIAEIDRRLNILWTKRQVEHDPPLPIAIAHIQAALSLSDPDWKDWNNTENKTRIKNTGDNTDNIVRLDAEAVYADTERIELIKRRGTLLAHWVKRCESTYLDTSANPLYKGGQMGATKGLELVYGYKSTDQLEIVNKGDDLSIGLEAFRKRQAAKAAKTS